MSQKFLSTEPDLWEIPSILLERPFWSSHIDDYRVLVASNFDRIIGEYEPPKNELIRQSQEDRILQLINNIPLDVLRLPWIQKNIKIFYQKLLQSDTKKDLHKFFWKKHQIR